MFEARHPRHGLQFSATDAVVLLVGVAVPWPLWPHIGEFALLAPFTVLQFFLFCNVFRVPRRSELVWTGIFLVHFTGRLWSGAFTWWGVLGVQSPVTVAVVVHAVRQPSYHGVGSRPPEEAGGDSARGLSPGGGPSR